MARYLRGGMGPLRPFLKDKDGFLLGAWKEYARGSASPHHPELVCPPLAIKVVLFGDIS